MGLFDTGIRPAVDKWLLDKSKEIRSYGDYWSASQAGYCMRKVIFERLGVPKIESEADARKQRVFTSGHLFHSWIQSITKEAGLSIAQELELQDESLMVRGHIDDLVLVGEKVDMITYGKAKFGKEGATLERTPEQDILDVTIDPKLILYDYKTVNSRAFMWAKKKGNAMSYYHRYQLGTYMYMLRKSNLTFRKDFDASELSEARILKIEKDSLMMGEQQLMWSDELHIDVVRYWTDLNTYWTAKKIPPCTCHEQENGFLAKEAYNGYFFNGEPCSLEYYRRWKDKQNDSAA